MVLLSFFYGRGVAYLPELELETVKQPDLLPKEWIYGVSDREVIGFGSHESRRK